MASFAKRKSYASEITTSSDEDSDYSFTNNHTRNYHDSVNNDIKDADYVTGCNRKKSLSRNAVIARENRIKKKVYMQRLESNVDLLKKNRIKLTAIIQNQSLLISELRREIKYMKGVLANSADLNKLIKAVHCNTGMSVTTSLDKTLMLNNDYVSKHKASSSVHPWKNDIGGPYLSNPASDESSAFTSLETDSYLQPQQLNFNDLGLPLDCDTPFPELLDFPETEMENASVVSKSALQEHNYTSIKDDSNMHNEDVGICLHVSQHRVSLEFCSTCSQNANQAWKGMEK